MTTLASPLSPRIAMLKEEIEAGNTAALAQFWHDVAAQGTPLSEAIEGDDTHLLVTFLWRAGADTASVAVLGGLADWENLPSNQASRLLDTDLWYKSYQVRNDIRTTYWFSPDDSLEPLGTDTDWQALTAAWQHDPLNPRTFFFPKDEDDPQDQARTVSVLELPAAPPQPWIATRASVPSGRVELHHLRSLGLNNERRVWVYTPPSYTASGQSYGLLVLLDGLAYTTLVPTPTILDNLLAQKRIPPLVAVLPDSLSWQTRSRELACSHPFADFLTQELLPWVRQHYRVTSDPARTIVGGSSFGGLAAAFAGLRAPQTFGHVLSQSGSFWWAPEGESEHEWLTRQYAASPTLSLRFYLDVGLLESVPPPGGGPSQLTANRHLRDVLQAKGYPIHYAEYNGGHDYLCWRGTLADGLLALVGN